MNAILLAAGVGKRLQELTADRPKCLIPVGGRTILSWMRSSFEGLPVERLVVVVGYRAEMIQQAVASEPDLGPPVTFLHNPRYTEGAILSLHTAREHLGGDALVLDADVLFHPAILRDLVLSAPASSFLCDTDHAFTGEEMMLHGTALRVVGIHRGVHPGAPVLGEAVGFLKLGRDDASLLRELMEHAIAAGRTGIEHEELYNDLLARRTVAALPTGGRPWTEIDFLEDVRRAEAEVLPAVRGL